MIDVFRRNTGIGILFAMLRRKTISGRAGIIDELKGLWYEHKDFDMR